MLKEIKARYEKGRLVLADGAKPPPDGTELVVVYQTAEEAPVAGELYGAWAGKFPEDFDIEKELREVRAGWQAMPGSSDACLECC